MTAMLHIKEACDGRLSIRLVVCETLRFIGSLNTVGRTNLGCLNDKCPFTGQMLYMWRVRFLVCMRRWCGHSHPESIALSGWSCAAVMPA